MKVLFTVALVMAALLVAPSVEAHHEAIFGPQSSLVLSAPAFLSVQSYTRRLAAPATGETNALVSGGLTPLPRVPFSGTAILTGARLEKDGAARYGVEDVILGARYRLHVCTLLDRFHRPGNF